MRERPIFDQLLEVGAVDPLFDRLREEMGGDIPTLISSHPPTQERAAAARARARQGLTPSMSEADWRIVQSACGGSPAPAPPAPAPEQPAGPTPKPAELDGAGKD